jgi:tRNA(Leu) C34 or U34 (ribose-2'-O)-methylase TrmL
LIIKEKYVRGFFGIGVEGINKAFNVGSVFRSAHAFGASFSFTVAASYERKKGTRSDTSDAMAQLPFYEFPSIETFTLPKGCALVGVELDDDAIELPSFRHPSQAAYVLGSERGGMTATMLGRCDHIIQIPSRFSLNLGIAGVCVMYDRLVSLGRFAPRPVKPGGPTEALDPHVRGDQILRQKAMEPYRSAPPLAEVEASLADERDD